MYYESTATQRVACVCSCLGAAAIETTTTASREESKKWPRLHRAQRYESMFNIHQYAATAISNRI